MMPNTIKLISRYRVFYLHDDIGAIEDGRDDGDDFGDMYFFADSRYYRMLPRGSLAPFRSCHNLHFIVRSSPRPASLAPALPRTAGARLTAGPVSRARMLKSSRGPPA